MLKPWNFFEDALPLYNNIWDFIITLFQNSYFLHFKEKLIFDMDKLKMSNNF